MKKAIMPLIIAGALAGGTAFGADSGADADAQEAREDLEDQLEDARERLEEAAREVAELSAEIGKPIMAHFKGMGPGSRRAVIGVQLDTPADSAGALVTDVSPGGPAAEAGIQPKDIIIRVNGTEVKRDAAREVVRLMQHVEPESKVDVRVLRAGKPKDFVVIARPVVFPMFDVPLPPPPSPPGAPRAPDTDMSFSYGPMAFTHPFGGRFADMEFATLTPQLGSYFGTREGVLVVRAPQDQGLKLQDGDVILSIDGRKPTNGSHATRILRSYQPGEKVAMRIMRQKKTVDLSVTLPERSRAGARSFSTEE